MPHTNKVVAQLFEHSDGSGHAHGIEFKVPPGGPLTVEPLDMQDLSGVPEIYGKASRVHYDCPPGIVLVFGENLSVDPNSQLLEFTGMGQADLHELNFGDRIKCWMWKQA